MQVTINKADLWGNLKDGFDNNGNHTIAKFETDNDLESTELCPKSILKLAQEYFAGYGFALTEAGSNYIGKKSKSISVEWEGDDIYGNPTYGVFYRGQYVGEIILEKS